MFHSGPDAKLLFDGRLEIHSDGSVFRVGKEGGRKPAAIHLVGRDRNYPATTITIKGKQKAVYIHRLVAEAFVPNPEKKPHINHIDSNPQNNHASNLEWCTPSENTQHAYKNGRIDPTKNMLTCRACGLKTRAKNGVCARCKREKKVEEQRALREQQRKVELLSIDKYFLTENQRSICELRAKGMTLREIADELGFSYQYVGSVVGTLKNRPRPSATYPVLALAMRQKNVRAYKLAEAIGVSPPTMYKKLKGEADWKLTEILAIKDFLNIDTPVEKLLVRKDAI